MKTGESICHTMLFISANYTVVRCLMSVTFVYCVETTKDAAVVATECE